MSALNSCPYKCEQKLCACCELSVNRLKQLEADHVSKSELRAWCEDRNLRWRNGMFSVKGHVVSEEYDLLLEKFCKGEK